MVQMSGIYRGEKRCELTHEPSGSILLTDAPRDNHGKGEAFSPTDLVGAALGSCILTTLAIVAERDGLDIQGASFKVQKEMTDSPRKIASLSVKMNLPSKIPETLRPKYEKIALTCPVHRSLSPEVQMPITFHWDLN